jgi:protein-disulfide isomerase
VSRRLGLAALLVFVLLVAGCGESTHHRGHLPPVAGAQTLTSRFAGIPQHGATLGNPHAPVTMVEFIDLQCPFCSRFDRLVLPTVLDRYVRTGKVKIEARTVALLGPDSGRGAAAAHAAARQNRFWSFADLVYRNQGRENSGYFTDAYVRWIARAVPGLDVRRMLAERRLPAVRNAILDDARTARAAQIPGTPWFRVGPSHGVLEPLLLQAIEPNHFVYQLNALLAKTKT